MKLLSVLNTDKPTSCAYIWMAGNPMHNSRYTGQLLATSANYSMHGTKLHG